MDRQAPAALPKDLADARSQFRAWRARRTPGRLPRTLWALAVRLAHQHGLRPTATALGLDLSRLRQQARRTTDPVPAPGPAFIEVPPPMTAGKQAVVELRLDAGATLRLHLTGYDAAEVAALARRLGGAD